MEGIDDKFLIEKRKEILEFAKRLQKKAIDKQIQKCIDTTTIYFKETDALSAKICKKYKINPSILDSFLSNPDHADFVIDTWANPLHDIKVKLEKRFGIQMEVSEDEFFINTSVAGINIEFWDKECINYKIDNEYLLDIAFLHGQGFDLNPHLDKLEDESQRSG